MVFLQCFASQMSKFKREKMLKKKKKTIKYPYLAALSLANYWVQVINAANRA